MTNDPEQSDRADEDPDTPRYTPQQRTDEPGEEEEAQTGPRHTPQSRTERDDEDEDQ